MTADIVRTIAKGICCGAAGKCLAETRPCAAFVHDPTAIRALAALDATGLAVVPKPGIPISTAPLKVENLTFMNVSGSVECVTGPPIVNATIGAAPTAQPAGKEPKP